MEPIKKLINGYFFLTIFLIGMIELMSLFGHFFLLHVLARNGAISSEHGIKRQPGLFPAQIGNWP